MADRGEDEQQPPAGDADEQRILQLMQAAMAAAFQQVLGQNPNQNPALQNMINQQVQQQVQAQLQQWQQQNPPQGQGQQQQGFMVTPALNGNAPWNLAAPFGAKVFMGAVEPLAKPYDGDAKELKHFLRKVYMRAQKFGFTDILTIVIGNNRRLLTTHYGCITLAQVQAAAILDMQGETRSHQAQEFLVRFLEDSVGEKILDRLATKTADYTVNVAQANQQAINKVSGTCLLFVIIGLVSVHTRATVATLLDRLDDLEAVMEKTESNIETFNDEIEATCDALRSKGEEPPRLLNKLFKGYLSCADTQFVDYIKRKKEAYMDESLALTDQELMDLAVENFKIRFYEEKNWMEKSAAELEFIAMQTEFKRKMQLLGGSRSTSSGAGGDSTSYNDRPAVVHKGKWAWKNVAPKPSEPKEKVFQGKTYIHCPHHETTQWVLKEKDGVLHAPACEARRQKAAAEKKTKKTDGDKQRDARHHALSGVMEDPDAAGDTQDADEKPEKI